MKTNLFRREGFTFIELLIVIAILAILVIFVSGNYINSLGKGRDARRKSDLVNLQKALELFYDDSGSYPSALPSAGNSLCYGSPVSDCTKRVYMLKIPGDPNGGDYQYCSKAPSNGSYQIYASLENAKDSQVIPAPDGTQCLGGATCTNCFGVSSSNISP